MMVLVCFFYVRYWDPNYYRRRRAREDEGKGMNFIESVSFHAFCYMFLPKLLLSVSDFGLIINGLFCRFSPLCLEMEILIKELKKRGGRW